MDLQICSFLHPVVSQSTCCMLDTIREKMGKMWFLPQRLWFVEETCYMGTELKHKVKSVKGHKRYSRGRQGSSDFWLGRRGGPLRWARSTGGISCFHVTRLSPGHRCLKVKISHSHWKNCVFLASPTPVIIRQSQNLIKSACSGFSWQLTILSLLRILPSFQNLTNLQNIYQKNTYAQEVARYFWKFVGPPLAYSRIPRKPWSPV